MIDFLAQYGKYIALGVVVLLEIVILILKKRPVKLVDAVTSYITQVLPYAIKQAEGEYPSGHGKEKLDMVIQTLQNFIKITRWRHLVNLTKIKINLVVISNYIFMLLKPNAANTRLK